MSNPFEDNDTAQNPRATASVSTMRNTNNNSSLQERADQLRRREEDIIRREQMLATREQIIIDRESSNPRKPNWPIFRPWIYHDIAADIPDQFQKHVKLGYANWIVDTGLLLWNFICLIARISVDNSGPAIADFILSLIFFFALSPIIFFIYRLLYRGARKTKKSLFLAYLCFYFLNILIHIFFAIGVAGTGAGGFFVMLNMFNDDHKAVGIMLLVAFILWVIMSVFSVYHWIHIRVIYGRLGGNAEVKKEATSKAVQEAKNHPELFVEAAKTASDHPELFSAKAVV